MTGAFGYATNQGLGIQMRAFIDHGIIDKLLIKRHTTYQNHYEWYKPHQIAVDEQELLDTCDRIFFMETLFDHWYLIPECKKRGIKTILIVHYECTPHPLPNTPDIIIAPSSIDKEYFPSAVRLNIPVDMPWKLRKKARVFVHNSGHGGLGGRNGTKELLSAMSYVKSPVELIVRTQETGKYHTDDPRVKIVEGNVPYEELFTTGDVFILPEKFGGSFLPMQEAFASGMPVMSSARSSNNWLPQELLIPVDHYKTERITCQFDSAVISPEEIAKKIDWLYNQDITQYSLQGKDWAKKNNWKSLTPHYEALG